MSIGYLVCVIWLIILASLYRDILAIILPSLPTLTVLPHIAPSPAIPCTQALTFLLSYVVRCLSCTLMLAAVCVDGDRQEEGEEEEGERDRRLHGGMSGGK